MVASLDDRVSCGKCVLGEYFFCYNKSITIKVSWACQDIACSPETVQGSRIATALEVRIHCDSQYAWQETKSRFSYGFHFNCIKMEQTSVSEAFVFMLAPYACFQLGPPWLNLR